MYFLEVNLEMVHNTLYLQAENINQCINGFQKFWNALHFNKPPESNSQMHVNMKKKLK